MRKRQLYTVLLLAAIPAGIATFILLCAAGILSDYICFWGVTVGNTVMLFLGSAMLGLLIGFVVGWGRSTRHPLASVPAGVYVETLRGIPRIIIVLLAIVIFPRIGRLTPLLGWLGDVDSSFLWGIIALGISSGAYQAEVFRSGFESIAHGQIEAAHSLGLTYWQTMRHITLPQVVRTILPPLGNEWIIVLKDTSLLVALTGIPSQFPGVFEVTARARSLQLSILDPSVWPLIFLVAAAVYLVLTIAISKTIQIVEENYKVPGLGVVTA